MIRIQSNLYNLHLLVALVSCISLFYAIRRSQVDLRRKCTDGVVDRLGKMPVSLSSQPMKAGFLGFSENDCKEFANRIVFAAGKFPDRPTAILHSVKLKDLVVMKVADWLVVSDSPGGVSEINLDFSMFQTSWRGLELRQSSDGERIEHRDQLLSALARMGVSLDCEIRDPNSSASGRNASAATVRDLLRVSVAEFHLNQLELAWTANALALYLPPQRTWENRLGEEYDFDMLVEQLMARPLTSESCAGIHIADCLTTVFLVDREYKILLSETRVRLKAFLLGKVKEAVGSQLPDGAWPVAWATTGFYAPGEVPQIDSATETQKMLVVSHLLEWFNRLPEGLRPPLTTFRRAVGWAVKRMRTMKRQEIEAEICPCTHAVLAVYGAVVE